ncbi:MAG TPA: hypothetical protein VFL85_01055 [Candidatus Saccharimonadales bacterium]|nr:hypothetical protein [Candidatus Saccharimonadales bacterium]
MSHVYLIGGGPGSGKSSIAQHLSKKFGLEYWKGDDFVGEHQQEAAERKFPVNNYVQSLGDDEQQLELIKLTAKQEWARQEELFYILLKELRLRKFDQLILEGNCLLPNLVMERFEYPHSAIWLVPTRQFQEELYPKRDWVSDLLKQAKDPALTLRSWIARDEEFNETIINQTKAHDLPLKIIDGKEELEQVEAWVEKELGMTHPHPKLAKKM